MIVMQQINTSSKDPSVVGPGTHRSGIPEGAVILMEGREYAGCVLLNHALCYKAHPGFQQVISEKVTAPAELPPMHRASITLEPAEDWLRVTFSYNPSCGAPNRWWAVKPFELRSGEWVRIAYNGRFSGWHNDWWYEKTVVNVGMFNEFSGDLFMRAEPTYRYALFSRLW
jgi:hypothetical protein